MEWQKIETAPKDGTNILLFLSNEIITIGRWNPCSFHKKPKPYWSSDYEISFGTRLAKVYQPTNWQPLPEPPKE